MVALRSHPRKQAMPAAPRQQGDSNRTSSCSNDAVSDRTPAFSKSATASTDLIELAFRTPRYRIGDPAVDVGFAPASAMDTDPDLGWECPLIDLAVDGRPG